MRQFGKQAERYQARIDRQAAIIDRLVAANQVYGTALYEVINESKNVKEARKMATAGVKAAKTILTVPEEEKK